MKPFWLIVGVSYNKRFLSYTLETGSKQKPYEK